MPFLEAVDVWFAYVKGEYVLRGVNLEVERGELLTILGPTGSGKTTLLLILAGLLKPERGVVTLEGKPIQGDDPGFRKRVGILFQNPDDQLFNPTVFDEIAYSLRTLGAPEQLVKEAVGLIAEALGIEKLLDKHPFKLSMGQKRLVALASILVYNPEILLLDEPLTFLDPTTALRTLCIIETLHEMGKTLIISSHNIEYSVWFSNRVCILQNGVLSCMDASNLLDKLDVREFIALHPALYTLLTSSHSVREAIGKGKDELRIICRETYAKDMREKLEQLERMLREL